jgi:hypothetical protein
VWHGKRIISEEWITEMTRPRPVDSPYFRGMQYGYLWWIIHPEKNIYAAIGNSGNVIYVDPEAHITLLREYRIVFLAASQYCPAMSHITAIRKTLVLPTLFNIMGPLVNPAGVTRQLVGVFSCQWLELMVDVLRMLGSLEFEGYDEWKRVVLVNSYFTNIAKSYRETTEKIYDIAERHQAVENQIKLFETESCNCDCDCDKAE